MVPRNVLGNKTYFVIFRLRKIKIIEDLLILMIAKFDFNTRIFINKITIKANFGSVIIYVCITTISSVTWFLKFKILLAQVLII